MPAMAPDVAVLERLPAVPEEAVGAGELDRLLSTARSPFVVRGLARDWPLVRAGNDGATAVRDYLVAHARQRPFPVSIGEPGGGGRLFYDADMGMNFRMATGPLDAILDGIIANRDNRDAPAIYLASLDLGAYFDGLAEANRPPLGKRQPIESIWIGTATRIAAHNDVPKNLAVCAAGRRRFTLFPPGAFRDLYPGPLENTPAGRPVSMVDFRDPDFDRFPRFRQALDQAMVAELDPGDAIFIPSLWWHHVEGLAPFNILVNYWWRDEAAYLGKPEDALNHAILAIRDLDPADKEIWKSLFDHYVFANEGSATEHIPPHARGILDPLDAERAGQIRAFLLRSLSR